MRGPEHGGQGECMREGPRGLRDCHARSIQPHSGGGISSNHPRTWAGVGDLSKGKEAVPHNATMGKTPGV